MCLLLRLDRHVRPSCGVLEYNYCREMYEQACFLVLECCPKYYYRYHDLCHSDAVVETIAASASTEDRSYVCVWIRRFVSLILQGGETELT